MSDRKAVFLPQCGESFISLHTPHGTLYGGDQSCFDSKSYRDYGCGVIAAANMIMCMRSQYSAENSDYMKLADSICRVMPPDADGLRWISAFRKFTGRHTAYYPLRFISRNALLDIIVRSLSDGLPPMISVYNPHGFSIEHECGGSERIKAHYMTVTGVILGEKRTLVISSWGKKYYIDYDVFYNNNRFLLKRGIGCGIGSGIFVVKRKNNKI